MIYSMCSDEMYIKYCAGIQRGSIVGIQGIPLTIPLLLRILLVYSVGDQMYNVKHCDDIYKVY